MPENLCLGHLWWRLVGPGDGTSPGYGEDPRARSCDGPVVAVAGCSVACFDWALMGAPAPALAVAVAVIATGLFHEYFLNYMWLFKRGVLSDTCCNGRVGDTFFFKSELYRVIPTILEQRKTTVLCGVAPLSDAASFLLT